MKKIAIVHDWLTTYAGAERVLEQLLAIYPQADLFTICDFLPATERRFLGGRQPNTSFIQNLPKARTRYRSYLAFMALAIEQFDLSDYELVISSSHAVAKGILTSPDQLHVSYVHSPIRYAWDLQHQYLRESGLDKHLSGWLAKWLLHKMRIWDLRTANGVDLFLTNSNYIAKRIWKVYRREATVIYPPVDLNAFRFSEKKADYYLTASRMVPYKRVDLIAEAFASTPNKRLKIIGDGPQRKRIESIVSGHSNIELLDHVSTETLANYMAQARAFVFAAEEDFGITPVEAQACGTPVIAFGRGGSLETVRGLDVRSPTGVFFESQSAPALKMAIERFEHNDVNIKAADCRAHAEQFSVERFRAQFAAAVAQEWDKFSSTPK